MFNEVINFGYIDKWKNYLEMGVYFYKIKLIRFSVNYEFYCFSIVIFNCF